MADEHAAKRSAIKIHADGVTPVGELVAGLQAGGIVGNAVTALSWSNPLFGKAHQPSVEDMTKAVTEIARRAKSGDVGDMVGILASQVVALNATYAQLMQKAAQNMGQHLDATDRYLRLALKAQGQTRATVETLAKLVSPREQTVRHIHIDNRNGQAVVADHVHTGGFNGTEFADQPRAIDAPCPSMPCPDALGQAVPVTSGKGE